MSEIPGDLLDDHVRFVERWFRDVLPPLRGRRWAVPRLDGGFYEAEIMRVDHTFAYWQKE
jgi:hypothetical protein